MWWNILPPFFIIAAAVAMPQFIAPISNWLLVGNFYRRSLLDPDLTKQYMRDTRLTGNPYILTNLIDVPEDDEEEELTEEQVADMEYDRCKALIEERELKEALDRPTKCPTPEVDVEDMEKCSRREALKKKRMQKRKGVPVVEKVEKQAKCNKEEEKDLCNVGPVCPPCDKAGEKENQDAAVVHVTQEDDDYDKAGKCSKKRGARKHHEPNAVVVPVATEADDSTKHDLPKTQGTCKSHEVTQEDNVIVVKDSGKKKAKSKRSKVADVPQEKSKEEIKKCPSKHGKVEEDEDVGAVVDDKAMPKKCPKKD